MATTTHFSTIESLADYQRCLTEALKRRFGVGLALFKILKGTTQLIGILAGVYAMYLGADPLHALALIAFIWAGPEAIEAYLAIDGHRHTSRPRQEDDD